MRTLIIDNGSTLTKKLAELSPGQETIARYNDLPNNSLEYDLLILSGSSLFPIVESLNLLTEEMKLIKNFRKPIIGICFGHELLAHLYGADVTKADRKHVGLTEITVSDDHEIFDHRTKFTVYENHSYKINSLPENCTELAHSDHAVAAFRHNELPHFGFQFHPEHHTEQQFGDEVFLKLFALLT